jgi:hypothetical protein
MVTPAGGRLLAGDTRRSDVAEMRRIAGRMEEDNPSWIVVFGVFTREFVAFPRFDAPRGTVVTASYAAALPPRMRAIEAQARPAVAGQAPAMQPGDAETVTFRLAG